MYIQVNAGRNVGTVPMSDERWGAFYGEITWALAWYAHTVTPSRAWGEYLVDTERHTGQGTWDGVAEESMHVSLYWDDDTAPADRDYARDLEAGNLLRATLRDLAREYGQDSIALVISDSELISA